MNANISNNLNFSDACRSVNYLRNDFHFFLGLSKCKLQWVACKVNGVLILVLKVLS